MREVRLSAELGQRRAFGHGVYPELYEILRGACPEHHEILRYAQDDKR